MPQHTRPHTHSYALESPDGPTSLGICTGCGKTKRFENSLPEQSIWRGRRPVIRGVEDEQAVEMGAESVLGVR